MPAEDLSKLKIDKRERSVLPSRRVKKKIFIGAVILLVVITGFFYSGGTLSPAVSVDVATVSLVYPSQSISLLNASGYIVAQRRAAVASKATGRLVELMVEEGSRVEKGQVIARLENDDAAALRDQAAANLNSSRAAREQSLVERDDAEREYRRYEKLIAGASVARSQFDAAEARYRRAAAAVKAADAMVKAAEAALRGAQVALEYTMIRAPFDAVVLTKNADIGDIVTPLGAAANAKAAVVTIADMGSLQVEVDVSETNISSIRVAQPCDIQLDAFPDIRFRGEVYTVVPTVDRSKATVLVKVRFIDRDPRMLPDMSAKVAFLSRPLTPEEEKPRLAAGQAALISRGDGTSVFLVNGNRVKEIPVTVGIRLGEMTEVVSGLQAGDVVVLRPPKELKDGSKIKIAEK
ncbi:MAG: efflux RND transporter periplasmic adaptor subunit [Deltaproteobacteria bacterium]|nr:efflux RND transporter periplasmic adaptor subunit [Deltaproteobacteria bacterium]